MKTVKALLMPILAVALCAPLGLATQTSFWTLGTFKGFLRGELEGISVSTNGQLLLAPETRSVFNPEETVALSMAMDGQGNLFIGTGHQGKVFKVNSRMQGKLLFQAPEPEILALAVGPDHDLYVASSPEGKIYRVTPEGKSSVFYNPKVKYIWALAFDAQGRLYAGTGDRGEILRINRDGEGSVFFTSDQTHIMCLAFDKEGNVLAGSEPGGLIYRITPQGKGFVLYQANLPEIHALATDSQGRIYAAALGNAQAMTPVPFQMASRATVVSAAPVRVTVVASNETGADPAQAPQLPPHPARAPSLQPNASAGIASPFRRASFGRGELIQILPNYTARTLWSSNQASIFGLATRGDEVVFSTDANGHIFALQPTSEGDQLTLLAETRASLPTRILADGSRLYVATSNIAKLIQVGTGVGSRGVYLSPVKNAKFISRWGQLSWRADLPPGCSLEFYTRSGNSSRPDTTWSAWAGPYRDARGSLILSTPARYIQWKAAFTGSNGESPVLHEVTLAYLNQNLPPEIHSLTVVAGSQKSEVSGTPMTAPGLAPEVTPVSVVSGPAGPSMYDSPFPGEEAPGKHPIQVSWQAQDPNGDRLIYSLYVKSADEQHWHLLKDKLSADNFSIPPDSLANGEYRLRLVASDSPSNPPGLALETDLVSAPFWVDNSPPAIVVISQEVNGVTAVVHFRAQSQGAPLKQAQVATRPGHWQDILSDDGIIDSQQETFTVRLRNLARGEHVISLRAEDTAGNVGVGKAVIEVP